MKLKLAKTLRFAALAHYRFSQLCDDLAEYLDPQMHKHYERIINLVGQAVRPVVRKGDEN